MSPAILDHALARHVASDSISLDRLDRLLEPGDAFTEGLEVVLTACAGHDLELAALNDGTADLCVDDPSVAQFLNPVFGTRRQLSLEEEIRAAKRIEFARMRLAHTLANAVLDIATRDEYARLTAVDYLPWVGRNPTISPAPNAETVQRRWAEWLVLRNDLIEHNLALVERVAMRYRTYGMPHGDVVQHGNLGLIRAADKYDWRHNVRFRTYAEWWIRQSIERATDTDRDVIHVPRPMRQKLSKAQRMNRKLGGPKLDGARFAELMGIDREAASHAFAIKSGILSIDRTADEDGSPLRNDIAGRDLGDRVEREEFEHLHCRLEGLMRDLPTREQRVLAMRFGLDGSEPRTLEECGVALGISRERVRQLQARALGQLRDLVVDPREPFAR
jgi:RNA polymerase primary sigma factor